MPDTTKPVSPLRKLAASLRAARDQHKERHRPSGFGFAFADRVDYLNGEGIASSLIPASSSEKAQKSHI